MEQTTIDIAAKLRRDFSFDDDRVQHFRGLDQLNNQLVDGLCRNKREDGAIIIQRAATRAPTNCLYPWPSRCLLYPSEQRNVTPGQVPSPCHIGPPWLMDDPCDGRRHCVCVYDEAVRNDTLFRRQKTRLSSFSVDCLNAIIAVSMATARISLDNLFSYTSTIHDEANALYVSRVCSRRVLFTRCAPCSREAKNKRRLIFRFTMRHLLFVFYQEKRRKTTLLIEHVSKGTVRNRCYLYNSHPCCTSKGSINVDAVQ